MKLKKYKKKKMKVQGCGGLTFFFFLNQSQFQLHDKKKVQ